MPQFRKKPVVIEAMQFDGSIQSADALEEWSKGATRCRLAPDFTVAVYVTTLEGVMAAAPGDWIIKGVKGEFYPCKPDIFAATYEAVNDD